MQEYGSLDGADDFEAVFRAVPGGPQNVRDIYPLSPLQEGMLFHRLLGADSDTYVLSVLFEARAQVQVETLTRAIQSVIDRHDILRTAFVFEGARRPLQVVVREAKLAIEKVTLSAGEISLEKLRDLMRPTHEPMDVSRAPLMKLHVASGPGCDNWHALLRVHHLLCDYQSLGILIEEIAAFLEGRGHELPAPTPFKTYVMETSSQANALAGESFFKKKLADVDEVTAPFGLTDVHGCGRSVEQQRDEINGALAERVREQSRHFGVTPARLFHAAWALVVGQTSGRKDPVFGTVLMAAQQRQAHRAGMIGMSVNTLPLKLQLREMTATQLVEQTNEALTELLTHVHIPLPLAQRCSGIGASPLFTALFNYRRSGEKLAIENGGVAGVRVLARGEAWTNYPIAVTVDDLGEGFAVTAQTDRRIDPQRIIGYVRQALESLVTALESAPQTAALALRVLPEGERQQLIEQFNATQAPYPQQLRVHELFEAQVRRTPQASAVLQGDRSLSYAELNHRANQLARYLRAQGVGRDQLVGICVERSVEMVIGLLGILKAGAAYVPLDPNYPPERLQYMLEDAAPAVVLTQRTLSAVLPPSGALRIELDEPLPLLAQYAGEDLSSEAQSSAADLVYAIYTSGSTGRPKGTGMPHRAMVNLIEWHRRSLPLAEGTRVLQFAALSFDVAFQETFTTLCTGGTLVLLEEWVRKDARALTQLLSDQEVQRLFVPPLMLQSLAECADSGLRLKLRDVITAGEQLRITPEIVRWFEHLPDCRLHNHYGPTETHVVTALTLAGEPQRWPALPTIGEPIANTQIYVLDGQRQPVPLGVVGEIYIGGANVARGYLHRAELTEQRFVSDPFRTEGRMYRTGDLGRWREDGTIEYLGRNDDQVKIRGFRIELGEIEAQLSLHEQVKDAVVIAREDVPGEKRLVAYLTRPESAASEPVSVEALRAHLKAALPEHMVPSAFVTLEHLPVTPSGKLNRRALPAPELDAYVSRQYEAPQGEVEEILAGIWQGLLRVERVGRQDNFFELGGHSLLIVQMMERLRRVGLSTQVRRVFESPTLADLAGELTREVSEPYEVPPNLIPAGCEQITPQMLPLVELEAQHIERIVRCVPGGAANLQDIYPLVPLQEGMLFHHLLNERGGDIYVRPMLLSLESRQRLNDLISALQSVIDRHDILRTAVLWEELPRPVQVVYRRASLPVEEIALEAGRDPAEQLKEWLRPERQKLDLRQAPLMRLQIAKHPSGEQWYALLQLHHIVADNTSQELFIAEINAYLNNTARQLPQSFPYRNHVAQTLAYAHGHDPESFFRKKLGDLDEPVAPFGVMDVRGDGLHAQEFNEYLNDDLALRVRAQAKCLGVSAATLFHAAWALVVASTTGRDDVVFGSVLLGRMHGSAGAQHILGMFVNTLPLRLRLREVSARQLVEQTQRELVELLGHEQASLAVAQRCSGLVGSTPLFTALLNYRHSSSRPEAVWSAAQGLQVLADWSATNYPITLSVDDFASAFKLTAQTHQDIDPRRIVEYTCTCLGSLVDALEKSPEMLVLALPVLPQKERRAVIELFNTSELPPARDTLINELFEAQVRRRPDAVAVTLGDQSLTYEELNHRATQLAHYLTIQGVGPDSLVGLCVDRSLEMVIGIVGILKAGGAYVPLDPSYPSDRLSFILSDARPNIVLTQERFRRSLPAATIAVIALDTQWQEITSADIGGITSAPTPLEPHHLAYVIYTSGSTGRPKGVMVEHRNVTRLFSATSKWFSFDETDVWTLFHSFAFDFSVWEIWGALLYGGRLVVVPYLTSRSPPAFYRLLCDERVTVLNQTPTAFVQLIDAQAQDSHRQHSLRVVVFGGEALETRLLNPWMERNGDQRTQLINMYGITETTVHVTYRPPLATQETKLPNGNLIGKPIPDLQVYVLNSGMQPLPVGVAGEMYVGGAGVSRGYINRPELTRERFIPNPFGSQPGARLYKTGDVGRWRPDGTLEYLGRNDEQVKIRGFRIELGEIQAQLARHPQVKDAAVIAKQDAGGQKRLIGYVVLVNGPHDAEASAHIESIRAFVASVLPEYMVPSAFVVIDKLPINANGKLDRPALPDPAQGFAVRRKYEAPQGEIEEVVSRVWRDVLHVSAVGREDSFFDLGGHSLLAMQAISRLNALLPVPADIGLMFEHPTLRAMAAILTERREAQLTESLMEEAEDIERMLKEVMSMSDHEVQASLQKLTAGSAQ